VHAHTDAISDIKFAVMDGYDLGYLLFTCIVLFLIKSFFSWARINILFHAVYDIKYMSFACL
jgi:hypothetical protein